MVLAITLVQFGWIFSDREKVGRFFGRTEDEYRVITDESR
jgi:hypothetical protein